MSRPSRVATIAVGYADGWLRSCSDRGSAAICRPNGFPSSDAYRWIF